MALTVQCGFFVALVCFGLFLYFGVVASSNIETEPLDSIRIFSIKVLAACYLLEGCIRALGLHSSQVPFLLVWPLLTLFWMSRT